MQINKLRTAVWLFATNNKCREDIKEVKMVRYLFVRKTVSQTDKLIYILDDHC